MAEQQRIRELRTARGVVKRQCTNLERFLNEMGPDTSIYVIEARYETVPSIRSDFEEVQKELERLDPNETAEPAEGQLTERESFENRYIQLKARFQQLLHDRPDSSFTPSHNSTIIEVGSDLPKISLPDFHGSYSEYNSFIDIFDTLVHNNSSKQMSNVRKLGILKGACKGKAFDAIRHFDLTDDNYMQARALLQKRFDNPRLNFEECLNLLWDAPKAHSSSSLRALNDLVATQINVLLRLGSTQQVAEGILIHLILSKFDPNTRSKWEENLASSTEIPSWEKFSTFLDKRCAIWEAIDSSKPTMKLQPAPGKSKMENVKKTYTTQNTTITCLLCHKSCNSILECSEFKKLAPKRRFFKARDLNLCYSCLKPAHETDCESPSCAHCGRQHHSLLHYGKFKIIPAYQNRNDLQGNNNHNGNSQSASNSSVVHSTLSVAVKNTKENKIVNNRTWIDFNSNYCFLATAIVLVRNSLGQFVPLRALFDGAAQSSFITVKAANLLGIPTIKTHLELAGVHGTKKVIKKAVKVELKATVGSYSGEFYLPVNPHYHDSQPARQFDTSAWKIPNNIRLADPTFNIPNSVDILLSADTTYALQMMGQIKLGDGLPLLQKTLLGWVIVGNYDIYNKSTHSINLLTLSDSIEQAITKFWTLEDIVDNSVVATPEQIECEEHYLANVMRKPDGRFIVKLPFRVNPSHLGDSYSQAYARYDSIRRKLCRDKTKEEHYVNFMQEYQQLGHCKPAAKNKMGYYIPHFHVENPGSTTTSFRVVFNASAPSSNGLSLNDVLMVGPTIQGELFCHLINLRSVAIAITGDISKMYRQIEIAPEDQKWQKIVWEDSKGEPTSFQLTTITYGTAPASFLATRVLKHLADEETEMLVGAQAIRDNMYMDDLLTGADTVEKTLQLFKEVKAVLSKGQLPIRKFCSNSPEVMAAIPEELHGSKLKVGDKDVIKTLGMLWLPEIDIFTFNHENVSKPVTKRGIISEVSSIFDPLGLVAPVTVLGKMLIQRLWISKVEWDESVPQAEATSWLKLRGEFCHINKIEVPRYVLSSSKPKYITLHGFGDASKLAYGAVFYIRTEDESKNVTVRLLCAKTKVAPLKTVTLPRLELLGAQLVAQLYKKVKSLLTFQIHQSFLWLDASIALTWIKASPHKWTSFVATRVTKIQDMTADAQWRHVRSEDNPADIASRGMLPSKLAKNSLWFEGPEFLKAPPSTWSNRFCTPEVIPETASITQILTTKVAQTDLVMQSKYHSWNSLQHIFGYVNRFIVNLKTKVVQRKSKAPSPDINRQDAPEHMFKPPGAGCPDNGEYPKIIFKNKGTRSTISQISPLDAYEVNAGLHTAVKIVQLSQFGDIINALQSKKLLPKSHRDVAKLNPFVDEVGCLRVGGRLSNAVDMEETSKYPLLLPTNHPLTRSLFLHVHAKFMHAGPRAMLGVVFQKFWPLKAKVVANKIFKRCVRCQWIKPTPSSQIMGQLPSCRVSKGTRAFISTGVDYFEPLWIAQPGRGRKPLRSYVCLFVCMTTKAIHMELVDDLSTPGFINAFQRFISRRGMPSEMFSDNGRNFVGARNLLYDNQEKFNNSDHWQAVFEWCRAEGIVWHFTPPRTPHQGGLWESAVKSAKYHLIRAIGQTSLYRAEMETVLVTVEAILNSRPLIPVSPHPEDGCPLTPGHFLIGGPLKSLPDPYLADRNLSCLERYKRLVAIKQSFWQKWSKEYLHTLMNRYKWTEQQPNLKINDYVLLVDKNTKPLMWQWGKIVEVHPGQDGKVRRVTVKTTTGNYVRGITEVCPLPFDGPE